MNTKIASIFAILFSFVISAIFFAWSQYQNKLMVDEFTTVYSKGIIGELSRLTQSVRNELLQENIQVARNRLAQMVEKSRVKDFDIIPEKPLDNLPRKEFYSTNHLLVEVPVKFNEGGKGWGKIVFEISAAELFEIESKLNSQLLKVTLSLWCVLAITMLILYFVIAKFSRSIAIHIRYAMEENFNRTSATLGEALWYPLIQNIYSTGRSVSKLKEDIADLKNQEQIFKIARKVAHDIRSPVGALKVILNNSKNLTDKEKNLLAKASQRIESVADEMLSGSKASLSKPTRSEDILAALEFVIQEKKFLNKEVRFEVRQSKSSRSICNLVGIQNIISNLVNNSFESKDKDPFEVLILVEVEGQYLNLNIQDNGAGMSQLQIDKALSGTYTTKIGGNSIGLSAARNLIESWGGRFSIASRVGEGTTVTLALPIIVD